MNLQLPRLHQLPSPWRWLLTIVVIFLGAGYLAAVVNVYAQNELTDGEPGLGPRDLLLKFAGGTVEVKAGEAPPSRMLEMIAGSMRQYFSADAHYDVLAGWLADGASAAGFTKADPANADMSPELVIMTDCLGCHGQDSGEQIANSAPFGPDSFTPDFEMVSKFTVRPEPGAAEAYRPPQDWRHLALVTHAHLLSVPIFVVLLAALFLWAGWPASTAARGWIACLPLAGFLLDVACWWLARLPNVGPAFAYAIGATGALFGVFYVLQWGVVMLALWRPMAAARGD